MLIRASVQVLFLLVALTASQANARASQASTAAAQPAPVTVVVEDVEKACAAGDAEACASVGLWTLLGMNGLAEDAVKAAPFLQRACDLGPATRCTSIADAYRRGNGVPVDLVRALMLFTKACDDGSIGGCHALLAMQSEGQAAVADPASNQRLVEKICLPDPKDWYCTSARDQIAMIQLTPADYQALQCDAGQAYECLGLGNTHAAGDGVPVDKARAAVAYGKACDLGLALGCNTLGLYYARGTGVGQDIARAARLFEQGCTPKAVDGCANLGAMYFNGTGVPKDLTRAAELHNQACAGGDARGCDYMERATVAIMGTPEQRQAEAQAQEREWKRESAANLQRAYEVNMGDLAMHFEREAQTQANADEMLARINSQAASAQVQSAPQAAALRGQSPEVGHPVSLAVPVSPAGVSYPSPASASMTSAGSGPIEMFVFFINLGGKTVAFEGPLALSRAEGNAMEARLQGEAPDRYGAGAAVDARSRGGGWCAFVYQRPGEERYIMGSETTLSTTTNSMKSMVRNLNAVIHHDVVCP